jgi:hypothetical protein
MKPREITRGGIGHVARMERSDGIQSFSEYLKGSDTLTDMRVLWKLIWTLLLKTNWCGLDSCGSCRPSECNYELSICIMFLQLLEVLTGYSVF